MHKKILRMLYSSEFEKLSSDDLNSLQSELEEKIIKRRRSHAVSKSKMSYEGISLKREDNK